jgi:hypothetical protein
MHNAKLRFAAALAIVALSSTAQAQTASVPIWTVSVALAQTSTGTGSIRAQDRKNNVGSKISTASPDRSGGHLHKERVSFLTEAIRDAAAEIREGTDLLENEAGHAMGEAKEAFTALTAKLENFTSVRERQQAFARTLQAVDSWYKKEIRRARQELKAVAKDVETAAAQARHRTEAAAAVLIQDSETVSNKLMKEIGWRTQPVGEDPDEAQKAGVRLA